MPQLPDLTRPIMRRAASLNANQTRRQGLEERQYFRPLQLPPQYWLASCIDAVQLEDPLGDVQTDCGNLHGGRLLQFVALNGPSLTHRCRQGSSTASDWETWPAQLEKLSGTRVINGGVFAYGIDQAFLRARRLLDRYRFSTLIFSFISDDISRCRYSKVGSAGKPYFD